MKPRRVLPRLKDILAAIEEIEEYTAEFDYGRFQREKLTYRAVERAMEIISEASHHIPEELTQKHPGIPWADVRGIGNILRHEYQRVAPLVIWKTATGGLPTLETAIETLIADVSAAEALSKKPPSKA